ncbi:L-glyceraldehyde 3-phosphate reductase [Cryobacterium melibiosiphilum]|uniref:L-glyceraldehyde 3-phosphate reductase n=1 Tax=Cryobacterium melibiosiphilum TaxID=995039 RepID=A0A3A5MRK1_9MICO|nr:L-glyceraldehyde 3-phosphate reductase [Cryobacterium melibiosiphilum]RJT90449.1 L-glyceraldehyde 3-phosphate reductase [Cryobacterium melibiosiphilum]
MTARITPAYAPASERYDTMQYRRVGTSGLRLPAVSLGMWHNFGDDVPINNQRAIMQRAFDLGITHFDLANGYGPPMGASERNVGRLLEEDFSGLRNELIISTKAGYPFYPGPYGSGGSRKYLLGSLETSLTSLGLDYVDIFYSHRFDPETPIEETAGALDSAVREGKARYVGISSYSAARSLEMITALRSLGTPLVIHQPSYSLLNRWVEVGEPSLLQVLGDEGVGCIAFSALAQGLLTDKYLNGIPADSRATQGKTMKDGMLSTTNLDHVRELNVIAAERGQTLAQMAVAWLLKDQRVSSVLVGASRPSQLEDSVRGVENTTFTADELARINVSAQDGGLNIWAASSNA